MAPWKGRAMQPLVPKGWTVPSRKLASPTSKLHCSGFSSLFELLFKLHVAKQLLKVESQFCDRVCMSHPFRFLSGCFAISISKTGLFSFIHSLTHSVTMYLAGAVSKLGEEKGSIILGGQRALTSKEGMFIWLLLVQDHLMSMWFMDC